MEFKILFAVPPYRGTRVPANLLTDLQVREQLDKALRADVEARMGLRELDERTRHGVNRIIAELMFVAHERGLAVPAGRPE